MSIVNLLLIIIIVLLLIYCGRLRLRQQPRNSTGYVLKRLRTEVSNNDVMQYIRDTCETYKPVMDAKEIDFKVKCSPESMMGWIDTDKADKIIMLLLSDMVRNATTGSKITLEAYTNKNYDTITIRLSDNGTKSLNTGIVLAHQLILLHHGTLRSKFFEGQGNTVVMDFSIKKERFQTELEEQTQEQYEVEPQPFHIPSNIELNIPTIELPADYDMRNQSLEAIVLETDSPDHKFLQRAVKCVNDHINDSDYDRVTFAADMGASVSTLYNKIRALTGKNVTAFIRDIRVKAACRLAKENPDLRVSDIAYRVGFKDPKYFATSFKRVTGMKPKEFFAQLRES